MGADLIIATLWIREDAKPDWEKAEAIANPFRRLLLTRFLVAVLRKQSSHPR